MVGLLLGKSDGDSLIIDDGLDDGRLDGALLGTPVGLDEGTVDGVSLSRRDGKELCKIDGRLLLVIDGAVEKNWLGTIDDSLGDSDVTSVGDWDQVFGCLSPLPRSTGVGGGEGEGGFLVL
ncbi:predicted protein [Chaetoceros tenuissimus]|uniref:Uncharacterized protein n=1 Tax=Chaetoceros tenuissimus TaxID=426638 RepID=A0AAD3HBT7_9STRA|nr:predicted protein [Chaetoceros tenuissimus]